MKYKRCSEKEFFALILEHRPNVMRERSATTDDERTYKSWSFFVGDHGYFFYFDYWDDQMWFPNPEIFSAALLALNRATREKGTIFTGDFINNPAGIIESETTQDSST